MLLRSKITSIGLNSICQSGPHRGTSSLFYFAMDNRWREEVLPEYHNEITSAGLNSICQEGPYQGASPLLFFIKDPNWRETLTEDDDLGKAYRTKISLDGLNSVCRGEGLPNEASVVYYLAISGNGRRLFRDQSESELLNLIDIDTLMRAVYPAEGSRLHLMPQLPSPSMRPSSLYKDARFTSYKESYILATEKNELYYIKLNGTCERVSIADFPKFLQDLQALNKEGAKEIILPNKQKEIVSSLITSNGGHTPARSAYQHLMDNGVTLEEFPVLNEKIRQWENKKRSSLTAGDS